MARGRAFFWGFGCTHETNQHRARCEAVGVGGGCARSSRRLLQLRFTGFVGALRDVRAIRRTRSTESSSLGSEAAPSSAEYEYARTCRPFPGSRRRSPARGVAGRLSPSPRRVAARSASFGVTRAAHARHIAGMPGRTGSGDEACATPCTTTGRCWATCEAALSTKALPCRPHDAPRRGGFASASRRPSATAERVP